jgi:hypothetical protein
MTDRIGVGTMLLEDGTAVPESLVVETTAYLPSWSSVLGVSSSQLGRQIEAAGWTFFYMAGEINRSGFGLNDQFRTDRALTRVIAAVKDESCNCLEITKLRRGSFLGVPYTSITAHARHIQKSRSFHDLSRLAPRMPFRSREWLYDRPRPLQNRAGTSEVALQSWENEGGPGRETSRLHAFVTAQ